MDQDKFLGENLDRAPKKLNTTVIVYKVLFNVLLSILHCLLLLVTVHVFL